MEESARFGARSGGSRQRLVALVGFQGGGCWLRDQGCDESPEEGFASATDVVHELEEAEIVRQLVLRDAAMRAQPGAQQGPETLDGVDVHLAEAVAVLVTGVFAPSVADGLVLVAPELMLVAKSAAGQTIA